MDRREKKAWLEAELGEALGTSCSRRVQGSLSSSVWLEEKVGGKKAQDGAGSKSELHSAPPEHWTSYQALGQLMGKVVLLPALKNLCIWCRGKGCR